MRKQTKKQTKKQRNFAARCCQARSSEVTARDVLITQPHARASRLVYSGETGKQDPEAHKFASYHIIHEVSKNRIDEQKSSGSMQINTSTCEVPTILSLHILCAVILQLTHRNTYFVCGSFVAFNTRSTYFGAGFRNTAVASTRSSIFSHSVCSRLICFESWSRRMRTHLSVDVLEKACCNNKNNEYNDGDTMIKKIKKTPEQIITMTQS